MRSVGVRTAEQRVRHTAAACCGHQSPDVQGERRAGVRRTTGAAEEAAGEEHGSSRQRMVDVEAPAACTARGARWRC